MRREVEALAALGPFPSYEDQPQQSLIDQYKALIQAIALPLTDTEAVTLAVVLSDTDFYGLAETLRGLIESAPGWPLDAALERVGAEWREVLEQRAENSRKVTKYL